MLKLNNGYLKPTFKLLNVIIFLINKIKIFMQVNFKNFI